MEKLMRQQWWKILAVAILVYSLIAGLLVPLKPNLVSVSPAAADLGAVQQFELLGYNTRFTEDEGTTNAWLNTSTDDQLYSIEASSVEVTDDRRATVTFRMPPRNADGKPGQHKLSMIVTGSANGTFVVPGAVTVRQEDEVVADAQPSAASWQAQALTAEDLYANEAFTFPFRGLLSETIRNTYFHVSLWFAMMFLYIAAVVYAIKYLLRKARRDRGTTLNEVALTDITALERADNWSVVFTSVGTLFGILGLLTGAVWAKYTWGSYWNWDIKQFTTLIALLIYAGYFVLRAAFPDPEQRARLGAVYNIFAFACLIPLIYILPRLSATSLHPGAEGNPALGGEDLDSTMRMVFYPTIIGWTLFGGVDGDHRLPVPPVGHAAAATDGPKTVTLGRR